MSSLKMTFSLTSLILLIAFGLVFAPTAVMADHGGPTVEITPYTGKNGDDTAYVPTRSDFRLKVTFSHLVTGFEAADVVVQKAASRSDLLAVGGATATLATAGTGATNVPASELTANKVFVVVVDLSDTDYAAGYLSVNIPKGAATGASGENTETTEAGSYDTSSLPKANKWTLTPELDGDSVKQLADGESGDDFDDDGKILAAASFTVNIVATNGPAGESFPIPNASQIQVKDSTGRAVSTASPDVAAAYVADKLPVTITFTGVTDAPIFVGVNPNWAGTAGTPVRIPEATTPTPPTPKPTVEITLSDAPSATTETFSVRLEFSEAVDMLDAANVEVMKTDPTDATMKVAADVPAVDLTKLGGGMIWIAEVDYQHEMASPLYVTVKTDAASAMTPTDGLMVDTRPTPTGPGIDVPGVPSDVTAMANQATDIITVSWTAPDTGGSAITGYTIEQTGAATATLTAGATDTSVMTGALAAGTYMFTVMATNSEGDGPASAPVSASIDAPQPGAPAVTATAGVEMATLTWTMVSGSTYEYRRVGTTAWMPATSPQEVRGLTAGAPVSFEVRVAANATANVPAGMIGTSNTVTPLYRTNHAPEVDVFYVNNSTSTLVRFRIRFTEPMSKDTNSISRVQAEDFRVWDHNGNPITGVTVSSYIPTTIDETTGDPGEFMEEYLLTVPLTGIPDARLDVAGIQRQVYAQLEPRGVGDEHGKEVEQPHDKQDRLTATFDRIPPAVLTHSSRELGAADITALGLPMGDYVAFTFVFDEQIQISSFDPDVIDQGSSHNIGALAASHFVLRDVSGMAIPGDASGAVYGPNSYEIPIPIQDPTDETRIVLKVGPDALYDLNFQNRLEKSYTAIHSPTANTAPVFEGPRTMTWTWCEGATYHALDAMGAFVPTKIVLPKARDKEGDDLTYSVSPTLPDSPVSDGLYWVTVDLQNRELRGTAKTTDANTYTWTVTDEHGLSDSVTFTVMVTAYQKPKAVTGVTAMKVDAAALTGSDVDKVKLTWSDSNLTTYPNTDCIPAVTAYVISRQKLTSHSLGRTPDGAPVVAIITVASAGTPLTYTTPKLAHGTYEFTIMAQNRAGDSPASSKATWDKTMRHWVIVDDPPGEADNLRPNVNDPKDAVTLDWRPPTENPDAPVNDVEDAMALYGVNTTFGGYHLEVTNEETKVITNYPKDGSLIPGNERTYHINDLEVGEYTGRVVAWNIAGKSRLSNAQDFEIEFYDPPADAPNSEPTFAGDATIDNITVVINTPIEGRTLPTATDADAGDKITYKITPEPSLIGLVFDKETRFLSGTPTTATSGPVVYKYTASDKQDAEAALSFTINVKPEPTVVTTPDNEGHLAASPHTNGVTTITSGMIAANGFATIGSQHLPDLEEFFDIGGTIGLDDNDGADDKNSRTVVISEILWGNDLGAPVDEQNKWQFIELYNTTNTAINLSNWMLKFTEGRPVPAIDIDQVSNRSGAGWNLDKKASHGQSGRVTGTLATDLTSAITPTNIISMYRSINYDRVEKTDHNADAAKNREEQLKGVPGGNASGSWKASQRRSAYNRWIYDSRRGEHFKTTAILTASGVAGTPLIINEIGNDTGSENDWVELRNVTDAEVSLKNYQLTMVTAKGTDTELFDFKDQDWKVAANGYVVISTRHPIHTDLAIGKDISIADDQEENKGASHLFVVKPVNLQDDGKFALILRNAHDKQGGDGNLIDVIATRQGAFTDNAIGTSLWPLKVTGLPHDNVIDGGDENFAAGKVYQRNSGNGRGEKQFAVRGYTGIGYDRAAANIGVNGGTPGYDNGSVKEKVADLSNATVSFSEIMLETTEGRQRLPQWIELYNSSMTQSVNINGWKLHVENANDVETSLDSVLTLDSMVIPPNQTILIVTNTGRVSDPDHFPSFRVVNLWTVKKHRDALEMRRRTDQVFSTTGLYLKLTDKDNKLVDEFGNLDGNRRTRDEPNWEIPMGEDDDRRSSLIRAYVEGTGEPTLKGTMKKAWLLADSTDLAYAISQTYYGSQDDFGTPGFRGGGPLPVSLSKFRPERSKDTGEIVVRWTTESELSNAGFNILRSEKRDGEFTKVHFEAGQGTTSERTTYEWKDTSAKPNVVYYYQIQDVSLDGEVQTLRQSRLKGNVTVAGKATTTWGEIKALQ